MTNDLCREVLDVCAKFCEQIATLADRAAADGTLLYRMEFHLVEFPDTLSTSRQDAGCQGRPLSRDWQVRCRGDNRAVPPICMCRGPRLLMAVAAQIRVFCSLNEPAQLPGIAGLVPGRSGGPPGC
jgi:hypothetical protein